MNQLRKSIFKNSKAGSYSYLPGLVVLLFMLVSVLQEIKAQQAVISSYFNTGDPRDEWTEILVTQDDLDMRNWTLRDNNSTQSSWQQFITFNNIPFWNHLRAGTVIMIWHRQFPSNSTTVAHPLDINGNDGYLEVSANDPAYFTGGNFGTGPLYAGNTLNISLTGDILQLRTGSLIHVHALGHRTSAGADFVNLPNPKLNHTVALSSTLNEALFVCPGTTLSVYGSVAPQVGTQYTAKDIEPAITFGLPNTCTNGANTNSDFWRSTRQPGWNSPSLTATPNGSFSQVTLSWNSCTDPYMADLTQGYIILRNTTNNFTEPTDGTSYLPGDLIDNATVIANISSTSTTSYTDNSAIPCGDNLYYRVYCYRYTDDNAYGNNYHKARGRAYNETVFAAASCSGPPGPTPPLLAFSDRNNFCTNDPGNIILSASGGTGSNLEWFAGGCAQTLIGTGNNISIPSPETDTVFYVRWTIPGCPPSSCIPVSISVSEAPTVANAGSDQSKCGILSTSLEGNMPLEGTGTWSFVSGPAIPLFGDPLLNTSSVTAPVQGTYVLKWTISNGSVCPPSTDLVSVEFSNAVTVVAGSNSPVCSGDDIILTSSIAGASYSWSGPNGFNSSLQYPAVIPNAQAVNAGLYSVTVSNIPGGCPVTTGTTVVTVNNSPVTPAISSTNIVAGVQDVCTGYMYPYSIEFPAAGSEFNWSLSGGGFITNSGSSDLINITWTVAGTFTLSVTETASNGCTGSAEILTIHVNSVSVASVSVSADNNPLCIGVPVTFTAFPENEGTSPQFTWFRNGIQAAAPNSPTFTFTPLDGDRVYVELNSSSPCAEPNPAFSETDTISVYSALIPAISIATSTNPVCSGSMVLFTSNINYGGNNPIYQWKKNGINVGANSPTYSDNALATNDVVSCILTSDESCANPTNAISNLVTMIVNPNVTPSISITADHNPSCEGSTVTFTANAQNGGNIPVFQWDKNGIAVGTNSPVYSDNLFADNDIINCTLTSNALCATTSTATGSPLSLSVNPIPSISAYDTINPASCGGSDGSIVLKGLQLYTEYLLTYDFKSTTVDTLLTSDGSGYLNISGLLAGVYTNLTVSLAGCTSVPVEISLVDPGAGSAPAIPVNSFSICPGETADLSASGCSGTIKWSNGDEGANITVSPDTTMYYTASCTHNGCTSGQSEPIEVFVKPRPQISGFSVTVPSTKCLNDGIISLQGLSPETQYSVGYSFGTNFVSTTAKTTPSGFLEITGCFPTAYYNVSVQLDGCWSDSTDIVVGNAVSPQAPQILASEDTICPGQTLVLTALGCNGTITWSTGITGNTVSINPDTNLVYTATCTENLCISDTSAPMNIVVVHSDFASIKGNRNVCINGEILLKADGAISSVEWITPDGSTETSQLFSRTNVTPADSGYYFLESTSIIGCTDSDSIKISVNDPPEITITSDHNFCAGTLQNLSVPDGFSSYLWKGGSSFSSITAIDEGQYWVMVGDTNGCLVSDTATVSSCLEKIYFPNAFTPNIDGSNDFFKPVTGSNVLIDYFMIVYNRWGQKIFETHDYLTGWDGTMSGNELPSGLYTYVVSYSLADPANPGSTNGTKLRGTVLLVK